MLPGLSKEEFSVLMMSVGTHAGERHISPIDVAHLLEKSVSDPAGSRKKCAEKLGVGSTIISTFLSLNNVAPDIRHHVGWRKGEGMTIPFSVMALISKLPHVEQRKVAAAVLESKLVWKEVVALIQVRERSGQSIDSCIEATLERRPDIEKNHLFIGAVSKQLESQIEKIPQETRDKMLLSAISKFIGSSDMVNCRLGATRFSIMTSEYIGGLLKKTPEDIEKLVNQNLMKVFSK